MKRLQDLPAATACRALRGPGLRLRTGPVVMAVHSRIQAVVDGVLLHYARHPVADESAFADFQVAVARPNPWLRLHKPQVVFELDGTRPFNPLPGDQGFPMLEWGMNWCISGLCHQYLTLHAAVLERNGRALVMPAPSGSGKSTLCSALLFRGWRLLSDELAVIDPQRLVLWPVPRPVSLKNASIGLIRRFAPEVRFGAVVSETLKGDVAHFQPPAEAVDRADEPALPGWIVLPRYVADAPATLSVLPKAEAMMQIVENAFNHNVHGAGGFELLASLVDRSDCYRFSYSNLDQAVAQFEALAQGRPPVAPAAPLLQA